MRRGADRHELGADIVALLFPDDAPHLRGLHIGSDADKVPAHLPGAKPVDGGWSWTHTPDDPHGSGRHVEIRVQTQAGRVAAVTAFVRSQDKMDIDAPYRPIRDLLDGAFGKPERERGGTVVFVWAYMDGAYAVHTRITRYKNEAGINTLEVGCRAAPGVKFQGPVGLANSKRRRDGPTGDS